MMITWFCVFVLCIYYQHYKLLLEMFFLRISICRDKVVVRKFSNVWTREVILNQENGLGHGLAYHYASLAVDELKACVESTNVAPKHKCIMAILDPFIQGIEKSTNRVLVKRIHSDVFGACATLVETNGKALSELKADQLSAMLFELGEFFKIRRNTNIAQNENMRLEKTICI